MPGISRSAGTAFVDVALGDVRGFQSELIGRMNEAASEAGRVMSQRMSEEMSRGGQNIARGMTEQLSQASRTAADDMSRQMGRANDDIGRGLRSSVSSSARSASDDITSLIRGYESSMSESQRQVAGAMGRLSGQTREQVIRDAQGHKRRFAGGTRTPVDLSWLAGGTPRGVSGTTWQTRVTHPSTT
jgi:hypothetical protein